MTLKVFSVHVNLSLFASLTFQLVDNEGLLKLINHHLEFSLHFLNLNLPFRIEREKS